MDDAVRRTDRAARWIAAPPERLWEAWTSSATLARWLPPEGMTGDVEALELQVGGALRVRLTHEAGRGGKTTEATDEVIGRFVALDPPVRLVLDVDFVSDDSANAGTMRMTWRFEPDGAGTAVSILCENVPPGIDAADHAAGLDATLANLAREAGTEQGTA